MELIVLLATLAGLVLLFETPRQWVARLFTPKRSNKAASVLSKQEAISSHSLLLYLTSSPESVALDQAIADEHRAPLAPFVGDGTWLLDKVRALNIATIGELDELVKRHAGEAKALSHAFAEKPATHRAYGLDLVLQIEAMNRYGHDWYKLFLKPLSLTSASEGYADDLYEFHQAILRARA